MGSAKENHIFSWNFTDKYEIHIDESTSIENSSHFVERVPSLRITFISYAMSIFESLMEYDGVEFL